MNKLFLALVLVAVVSCDDNNEGILTKIKSKHLRFYLSSTGIADAGIDKMEEQCPGVTEKLKTAISSSEACYSNVDDSLTLCEQIHTATLNCTAPLMRLVDGCLPEHAKGLTTLGVKAMVSAVDHFCQMTGESTMELVNPCLWVDTISANQELEKCDNKIKNFIGNIKEKIPNKNKICEFTSEIRSCLELKAQTTCKNPKTKKAVIGLFDAFVAPCSATNEISN